MRTWCLAAALSALALVPCDASDVPGPPNGNPVLLTVSHEGLQWTAAAGAVAYDVVCGDLMALRESGGDFSSSTRARLVESYSRTELSYGEVPEPGEAFWFLVSALPDTAIEETGDRITVTTSPFGVDRFYGSATGRHQLGGGDSGFLPTWKTALSTDLTGYTPGQTVQITLMLKNISGSPVTLNYPTTCEAFFLVEDAFGTVVYDGRAHTGCFMIMTDRTWQPSQSVAYSFTWNQTNDAGQQVPAGASYRIRSLGGSYEPIPEAVTPISVDAPVLP